MEAKRNEQLLHEQALLYSSMNGSGGGGGGDIAQHSFSPSTSGPLSPGRVSQQQQQQQQQHEQSSPPEMTESFLEPLGFSSDEEGSYDAELEEQEMLTSLDLDPMSETQHKDGFMGLSLQQQTGDGTESMRGGAESVGNQSTATTSISKNYDSRMSLGVSGRQIFEDSDQYNMDTSSGFY